MRLLGCLSIFLCILLLGISDRLKLEQRSRQWQELQELLRLCIEELQINQSDSEEILQTIWDRGFHSSFLEACLHAEGTIQQRLTQAAAGFTDAKLQETARHFALRFGMSTLELQLEGLRSLQKICIEESERSRQLAIQNGKLALNLGFFGGAAAVILLI